MPASLGVQGPGDSTMPSGRRPSASADGDLVVAPDHHLRAKLPEIMEEVVGEAVVIIDQKQQIAPKLLILPSSTV